MKYIKEIARKSSLDTTDGVQRMLSHRENVNDHQGYHYYYRGRVEGK